MIFCNVAHLPRSVYQALLDEWRAELSRKALGMTEADACVVLGIDAQDGQEVSRSLTFDVNPASDAHLASWFTVILIL